MADNISFAGDYGQNNPYLPQDLTVPTIAPPSYDAAIDTYSSNDKVLPNEQATIQIHNSNASVSLNIDNINLDLKPTASLTEPLSVSKAEQSSGHISSNKVSPDSPVVITEEPTSQKQDPENQNKVTEEEDENWCPESDTDKLFCALGVVLCIACLPVVGCYAITCGQMKDDE